MEESRLYRQTIPGGLLPKSGRCRLQRGQDRPLTAAEVRQQPQAVGQVALEVRLWIHAARYRRYRYRERRMKCATAALRRLAILTMTTAAEAVLVVPAWEVAEVLPQR